MINMLHFYFKVAGFLLRNNVVAPEVIRHDYDRLSSTYDAYFSRYIGRHSTGMTGRMELAPGSRVVDLACGTGTLSLALAEAVGERGEVIAVDRSHGMLTVAQKKSDSLGLKNIRFLEADINEVLFQFADNSLDAVTCGWAIGYANPGKLITTAALKLKKGGRIGIIENMRDTLAPVRRTAIKVAQALPSHINQLMDLHSRLPRGQKDLGRLFKAANLTVLQKWEGEEEFSFTSGAEVLDWVLHTGASAGFDKVMNFKVKKQCDELFVRYIERDYLKDGFIKVAHRYAAGIAGKGG